MMLKWRGETMIGLNLGEEVILELRWGVEAVLSRCECRCSAEMEVE